MGMSLELEQTYDERNDLEFSSHPFKEAAEDAQRLQIMVNNLLNITQRWHIEMNQKRSSLHDLSTISPVEELRLQHIEQ